MNIPFFIEQAKTYSYQNNQRFGQALYNLFRQEHPDVTIPEDVDCFSDDKKVKDFITFLYTYDFEVLK